MRSAVEMMRSAVEIRPGRRAQFSKAGDFTLKHVLVLLDRLRGQALGTG